MCEQDAVIRDAAGGCGMRDAELGMHEHDAVIHDAAQATKKGLSQMPRHLVDKPLWFLFGG